MIMVGGPGAVAPAARAASRGGGSRFTVAMPEAGSAVRTEEAPPVVLGTMLALQENDEPDAVRDRRARRHGTAILEALGRLQRMLLGAAGSGNEAEIAGQLASLTEMMPEAADPGLAAILAAVTMRARIELARRR